jgi:hypothetical protein
MGKLSKNRVGLILGIFTALVYVVWDLAVALIPRILQKFLDWIFLLHSLNPVFIVTSFDFLNAVLLVVMAFVIGYASGWGFAAVWNWIRKDGK